MYRLFSTDASQDPRDSQLLFTPRNPYPRTQVQIQQNIPLAPFTTLRIGGPARFFAAVCSEEELLEALSFASTQGLRTFVLGGGSNLLIPDSGFDGLVLHLTLGSRIQTQTLDTGILFQVDAGVDWDAFVLASCTAGLSGVECLAGIPGLTGASPIQNIGAYGQEVASTLSAVRAFDLQQSSFVDLSTAQCQFSYRSSLFNGPARGRYILTRVDFLLDPAARPNLSYADLSALRGTDPTPVEVYHHVRAIRDRKGMVIHPGRPDPDTRSAGSFFKNPLVPASCLAHVAAAAGLEEDKVPHWPAPNGQIKLPAAWLIERAGFPKGFTLGPVAISTRHTLALTNRSGTATAADLLRLRDHVADGVEARFGVRLEQEPVLLT